MYTPSEKRYERMIYNRCGKTPRCLPWSVAEFWPQRKFFHYGANDTHSFRPWYHTL